MGAGNPNAQQHVRRNAQYGRHVSRVDMSTLVSYSWFSNVRIKQSDKRTWPFRKLEGGL